MFTRHCGTVSMEGRRGDGAGGVGKESPNKPGEPNGNDMSRHLGGYDHQHDRFGPMESKVSQGNVQKEGGRRGQQSTSGQTGFFGSAFCPGESGALQSRVFSKHKMKEQKGMPRTLLVLR